MASSLIFAIWSTHWAWRSSLNPGTPTPSDGAARQKGRTLDGRERRGPSGRGARGAPASTTEEPASSIESIRLQAAATDDLVRPRTCDQRLKGDLGRIWPLARRRSAVPDWRPVITGYSTEGWGDFFAAATGAAAALSGLIFVGLSVNLRAILDADKDSGQNFLTGRALEALVAQLSVLAVSLVALTPGIHRGVLAAFVLVVAAESAISPARVLMVSRRQSSISLTTVVRLATAAALTLSFLAAGVTLAAGTGGGLYWLPASFVLAIFVAAVNSWVLLVEVLR